MNITPRSLCLLLSLILLPTSGHALDLDLNQDGLNDVWQRHYQAEDLQASEDTDLDGATNLQESIAGTHPRDLNSRHKISTINQAGDSSLTAQYPTELGKQYALEASDGFVDGWQVIAKLSSGTGNPAHHAIKPGAVRQFLRVTVQDMDSDQDGVSDWSEYQLDGFDPFNPESVTLGTSDLVSLERLFDDDDPDPDPLPTYVSLTSNVSTIYETNTSPTRFDLRRTEPLVPITVRYTITDANGPENPDYTITDEMGNALAGQISIPADVDAVSILLTLQADERIEFHRTLTLTLQEDLSYQLGDVFESSATLFDAPNDPEHELMYFTLLQSQPGVSSYASGFTTLFLNGQRDQARVSTSFSNLTSEQTAAHIHQSQPAGGQHGAGPSVESVPMGQFTDYLWEIRDAGAYTAQEILDSLAGQNGRHPLYLNIHSSTYPAGEIWGFYELSDGSTEFEPPADPPPLVNPTGDELDRDIARFLTQATFGPTPELIDEIRELVLAENAGNGDLIAGLTIWLDRQMTYLLTPTPSLLEYTKAADAQEWALYGEGSPYYREDYEPNHHNRRRGWWLMANTAKDHLRQRVAFALSEIFVTSDQDSTLRQRHYGLANFYDMLAENAFSSYRTLLEDVSLSPIMGQYLSHLKNQKEIVDRVTGDVLVSPDENYAREVMQLFSIGLIHLHPDGRVKLGQDGLPTASYDQTDITEMSKVFTGWSFSVRQLNNSETIIDNTRFNLGPGPKYYQGQWLEPMKQFSEFHDTGEKSILGDVHIPANQPGEVDLAMALDALSDHPNTAPFISRRLIQRLVTSNPSAGYLYRVSQVFERTQGNLGEVVKAILLDYEARSLDLIDQPTFGKQKEPIVRYIAMWRALDARSELELADLTKYGYPSTEVKRFEAGSSRYRLGVTDVTLGQTPQRAPSVFNWFLPDFSVPGALADAGLVVPEQQLNDEGRVVRSANEHYAPIFNRRGRAGNPLPDQVDDSRYNEDSDHVHLNLEPATTLYQSVISQGRSSTQAVEEVLDYFDLLLCSGHFKARYAKAPSPNPRSMIIDTVGSKTPASQRVSSTLYLLVTSPEYIIQK